MNKQRTFNQRELTELSVRCPYCGNLSSLVNGNVVYPNIDRLHYDLFYKCFPCDAHIGCINGTKQPKGRLANRELRRAKMAARKAYFAVIDLKVLYGASRQSAFRSTKKWLENKLYIEGSLDFDMMTLDECLKAEKYCIELRDYGKE